jgi:hypothetical protein
VTRLGLWHGRVRPKRVLQKVFWIQLLFKPLQPSKIRRAERPFDLLEVV